MVNINTAMRAGAFILVLTAFAMLAATLGVARASAQTVPSCSISATPASLGGSGSVTLQWVSNGATSASLNNGIGSVGTTGSWNISVLAETRTYILTISGVGGTSACSVTIPVGTTTTAPTCTLDASTTNVANGSSAVLSWNTTNTTNVYLTTVGSVSTSGSYTVYPTSGTTYQLTATGAGGTTTCTKTISVNGTSSGTGLPTCSLAIQPDIVFANGSAVISYNASGATSAWIDGGVGQVSGIGTKVVYNITSPRTYHMTATNSNGTTTCSDTIAVSGSSYVTPTSYNTYGNSYAYPYNNYTYPTQYSYTQPVHTTPTYYTPTQYYNSASYAHTAYPRANTVRVAAMPYTGPADALYVAFMAALTLAIGTVLYRNRRIVIG